MTSVTVSRSRPWATFLGIAALAGYCVWNTYWIVRGQVPGSIWKALTGLPSPTTGGTRSFLCLCQGAWAESLAYHPLTVPLVVLLAVSLGQVAWQRRLTTSVSRLWCVLLLAAWWVKLLSPADTW